MLALGRHIGKANALLVELGKCTHKCALYAVIHSISVVVSGSYLWYVSWVVLWLSSRMLLCGRRL